MICITWVDDAYLLVHIARERKLPSAVNWHADLASHVGTRSGGLHGGAALLNGEHGDAQPVNMYRPSRQAMSDGSAADTSHNRLKRSAAVTLGSSMAKLAGVEARAAWRATHACITNCGVQRYRPEAH